MVKSIHRLDWMTVLSLVVRDLMRILHRTSKYIVQSSNVITFRMEMGRGTTARLCHSSIIA